MTTIEICSESEYCNSIATFFGNFPDAYRNVKSQILKLETRQVYDESGNKSYDKMIQGQYSDAVALIPEIRSVDVPLYTDLKDRKVDFYRCRPVENPLTDYLKWEIQCYNFNSKHGERIYFFNSLKEVELLKLVNHDFMVFDYKEAFIHDYDESGKIQGGWKVTKQVLIDTLIELYSLLKSRSINYENYLEQNQLNYKF